MILLPDFQQIWPKFRDFFEGGGGAKWDPCLHIFGGIKSIHLGGTSPYIYIMWSSFPQLPSTLVAGAPK